MALRHLARLALSMPPRVAAEKVMRFAMRGLRSRLIGRLMRHRDTYPPLSQGGAPLGRCIGTVDCAALEPEAGLIRDLASRYRAHRFDLLGSGWTWVGHGASYPGFGEWRYGPGRDLPTDWRKAIADGLWPGNAARAKAILDLIDDPAYRPMDWQVDFISGYRWSVRSWGMSVPYGHQPGVDIKVPWELARLQHLPLLAHAHALGEAGMESEFRNQVLDFIGANPPGWGVNWACAMDVAIRAVNILMARDLFLAQGVTFDESFEAELVCAMLAHGRHVADHLEWSEHHRANHYLADICGLAWIAAYLPRSTESDMWLAFACRQLNTEIGHQFCADGGSFEASTSYHRLSAEMALYTVALILGLPENKRASLAQYDHSFWHHIPALPPAPLAWPPFDQAMLERLARASRFAADITKPSGQALQIGDNDSGRFFKLAPLFDHTALGPRERILDHGHLIAAAKGLFAMDLPPTSPVAAIETHVIAALRGGSPVEVPPNGPARGYGGAVSDSDTADKVTRLRITPPDGTALIGLEPMAYPEFGLFLWRNARCFISVRCGALRDGLGAHAHNDQLAVEIEIDGVAFARDPGTLVYTPDLAARNAYRSGLAHFAPRNGEAEPARLDQGPFRLDDSASGHAATFADGVFLGRHQGFGFPLWRRVEVAAGEIVIEDCHNGPQLGPTTVIEEHAIHSPDDLAALWSPSVRFSDGYGRRSVPEGKLL